LALSPLTVVKALQFHRIATDLQLCGTWNQPAQLRGFIEQLIKTKIPIGLPGERDAGIILTFDDGEENIYRHALPILREFGVRAVVFLIAGYIGKKNTWDISLTGRRVAHLDWDQIHQLKKGGMEIGSHGMTHCNLARLRTAELEYELNESKSLIEKELGTIRCISYPFNRINPAVRRMAARAGYRYGFGGNGDDDLTMKKEAVYITDTRASLAIKVTEKPSIAYGYYRTQQKVINFFTLATMIARRRKNIMIEGQKP
jgi:peptidoglycan/xylan/chitin deacetylase (PgdA/CDA1 family)